MKPEHLKEAGEIVSGLAHLKARRKLGFDPVGGFGVLRMVGPGFDPRAHRPTDVSISAAAAKAAIAVMQQEWAAAEAKLRRRAAQIELRLEP